MDFSYFNLVMQYPPFKIITWMKFITFIEVITTKTTIIIMSFSNHSFLILN